MKDSEYIVGRIVNGKNDEDDTIRASSPLKALINSLYRQVPFTDWKNQPIETTTRDRAYYFVLNTDTKEVAYFRFVQRKPKYPASKAYFIYQVVRSDHNPEQYDEIATSLIHTVSSKDALWHWLQKEGKVLENHTIDDIMETTRDRAIYSVKEDGTDERTYYRMCEEGGMFRPKS